MTAPQPLYGAMGSHGWDILQPYGRPAELPLIGRNDELRLIAAFLDRQSGERGALVLRGEPGSGKTALLDSAADAALATGVAVLRAEGVEFETVLSFSGLNQLLMPVQESLTSLPPVAQTALSVALGFLDGPAADHHTVSAATLALLRVVAASRPLLLVVDNLQWLDPSSRAVIGFLATRLSGPEVGLVVAFRHGSDLGFDLPDQAVRDLAPLDESQSNDLVSRSCPDMTARVRVRVLAEARGNPLALLEFPKALAAQNVTRAPAGHPAPLPLTRRLQLLYASSITALEPETRDALLLAALDGHTEISTLRTACRCDISAALEPAHKAGLIVVDLAAGRLLFRHPLIRAAVVDASATSQRRTAHQALADVLGDQPDRHAWHLAEAAVGPDEHVAALLEDSARRSQRRGDPLGAVATLTRAADLSPGPAQRARRLTLAAYVSADVTGTLQHASEMLRDAQRTDPGSVDSLQSAVAAAFVALNGDGNVELAHRLLVTGINEGLDHHLEGETLEEAVHNLLEVCLYSAQPSFWESFSHIISRTDLSRAPQLRLWVDAMADPVRTAAASLAHFDREIASLADETDPTRIERIATAAIYVDRVHVCRDPLLRVLDSGREGAAVASAIRALMIVCVDDFRTGRWDDAAELTDEGIAMAVAGGYELLAWPLHLAKAFLCAGRGNDAEAQKISGAMIAWAARKGADGIRTHARHVRTLSALGRGDYDTAYQEAAAISPAGTFAPYNGHALWVAFDLVEAAFRSGRLEDARAHHDAMVQAGIADLSARLALVVAGSAAIVASDADFADAYAHALGMPATRVWLFEAARLHLMYGERLRRARAITSARAQLGAALDIFEQMGAGPWIAHTTAELRAAGVGTFEVHATAALTPQELRVARLAASGMTNNQIAQRLALSRRTVGTHLEQIFPKLRVSSRAGLAEALAHRTAEAAGPR
jgi:DNA-binding CsgD family transcriptional regulator